MFLGSRKASAALSAAAAGVLVVSLSACSEGGQPAASGTGGAAGDSCMAKIKSSGTLPVGNPGYLPVANLDGSNFTGLVPDLLTAANAKIGLENVKLEPVTLDWAALVPALVAERIIVSGDTMGATEERKKQIGFTKDLWYITQDLLVQKGNPKNLQSIKDLVGHTATTFEGSIWIPDLQSVPGVDIRPLKTSSAIIQAVESGQVDAGLIDSIGTAYALKTNPSLNIEAASDYKNPRGKDATALGISPKCTDYADAVSKAFDDMKASGDYQKILTKWGLTPTDKWLTK